MDKLWLSLYKEAKNKLNVKEVSPFIETGNNSCAILASNNNIYCGLSITSNTKINSSAEKSAITAMFNDNEHTIKRMVILNELEETIPPSLDCLDYLLELCENFGDIEVLINLDQEEIKKISDLLPDWWGTYRNKKN